MDHRAPQSLRGWRWFFGVLAALVVVSGIAGWSSSSPGGSPVMGMMFLAPICLGLGFLAFVATDAILSSFIVWCRRYGPWLLIAMALSTIISISLT